MAFAAHIMVDVTQENIKKYDLNINIQEIEETIKDGKKPARVIGHMYHLTVKSQKLNLNNCQAMLHLTSEKESYLHVTLRKDDTYGNKNIISCDVAFSPDYLDKACIILEDYNMGSSFSYKLKIKDWIQTSEHKDNKEDKKNSVCVGIAENLNLIRKTKGALS